MQEEEMKTSIRFGVRLGWPFVNAATFVTKVNSSQLSQFGDAVETLKAILVMSGSGEIADRLVFEVR